LLRITALLGTLAISFSAIFVRLAEVSPSTAALFRPLYALPVLLIASLLVRERDHRTRRERGLAVLAGVILALDFTFWHRSIDLIGAGLATVLGNTQVAFVGLTGWMYLKERPTLAALLNVPVIFAGVVLITGLGRSDAYGADPILGAVYGVLTGLTYALFLILFRHANRRALAPAAGPLFDATVGATLGSMLFSLSDSDFSLAIHWPAHGWLIALALVAQVAGWLMISSVLPRLPGLDTSVTLLMQPMLTVLWGWLFFHEALSPIQWSGVAIVLGGIAVVSLFGAIRLEHRAGEER
jgi:drug/metabolite transporter (DMT)-like permease